jgi:hypothetical protein
MILLANCAPQAIVVLGTSAAIWLNAILSLGVISLGEFKIYKDGGIVDFEL